MAYIKKMINNKTFWLGENGFGEQSEASNIDLLLSHVQACNLSDNSRTVIVDGDDVIAIYENGKVFAS